MSRRGRFATQLLLVAVITLVPLHEDPKRPNGSVEDNPCPAYRYNSGGHTAPCSAAAYRPRTTSTPERTSSSFALGSLPTRTVNSHLSRVTICETFATDSLGSPVALSQRRTLPGADAHFTLLVKATQTAVAIRLRFKASPCMTSTGRRNPGFDPRGSPRSAHHTSPWETVTTRYAPVSAGQLAMQIHRPAPSHRREHDSSPPLHCPARGAPRIR